MHIYTWCVPILIQIPAQFKNVIPIFQFPIPIPNPQDIDDESVIETVDFTEFETMFQVKRLKKNEKQAKRDESKWKCTHRKARQRHTEKQ